ncbi:MAG: hypothetical protein Q8916_12535 [Bacteroidota bacterium]|nr:hypothetical protein [Bacteroidota bacterium]
MFKTVSFFVIGIVAITLCSRQLRAQVPITNEEDLTQRIESLRKQADSLCKEAGRLKDSLDIEKRLKEFTRKSLDWNSLFGKNWDGKFPKNFHFELPEIPNYRYYEQFPYEQKNPFTLPDPEQRRAPIDGFQDWYYKKLADRQS